MVKLALPSMLFNRLREVRGTTPQQRVADDIGVTRQTISSIENGRYVPSLELAMDLARYFSLYVEEMFSANGLYAQFPGRPARLRDLDRQPDGSPDGDDGNGEHGEHGEHDGEPGGAAVPEQVPPPPPQEDL